MTHCPPLPQVDDLKTQLEGCHQQLVDSSQHKQELEVQLRTALEREHDVRSGYISPVSYQHMILLHHHAPPSPQQHCTRTVTVRHT